MGITSHNRVLLTGFGPFGAFQSNPSEAIATGLDGEVIAGYRVRGLILPVMFTVSAEVLLKAVAEIRPSLVLCLGLAATRSEITPERIAINLDDADIPDNAGSQPLDSPIIPDNPAAYWSTLPVKAIVDTLRKQDLPASESLSAGSFVCNHVFYHLMEYLQTRPGIRGGFMHLPPEQKQPDGILSLDRMLDAVRSAISVSISRNSTP